MADAAHGRDPLAQALRDKGVLTLPDPQQH